MGFFAVVGRLSHYGSLDLGGWWTTAWPFLAGTLLAWAALGAGTSTLNEEWMIVGKDRFWVVRKAQPDLALLRATARDIAARVPPETYLLTQDIYLAVEAGRRVPPGFHRARR